jgi:hypothetical protein
MGQGGPADPFYRKGIAASAVIGTSYLRKGDTATAPTQLKRFQCVGGSFAPHSVARGPSERRILRRLTDAVRRARDRARNSQVEW